MRKWFWSCTAAAAAVVVAGGIYLTVKHDGSPLAALCSDCDGGVVVPGVPPVYNGEGSVPADPVAVEPLPVPPKGEVVAVAQEDLPAHIVIGEPPTEATEPPEAAIDLVALYGEPEEGTTPPPPAPVCPPVMSYCADDEEKARLVMPYADEEEQTAQFCTMSADVFLFFLGFFQNAIEEVHWFRCGEGAGDAPAGERTEIVPECHEDYHRHHHCPTCPYTGRSHMLPAPAKNCPTPAVEDVKKGGEEPSSPKWDSGSLSPPTSPLTNPAGAKGSPWNDIDTMEFRPSDAGLYGFIPGVI